MSFWTKLFGRSPTPAAQPSPKPAAPAPPNTAPAERPPNVVEEVKDIIRKASGARDFVSRANGRGFRAIKEDFVGLWLQKGDCTLILAVLPNRGPDSIWCLSMASKGSDTVNLIDEGKITF